MSTFLNSRKRSREDDICDSAPLSKRINNLHLNYEDAQFNDNSSSSSSCSLSMPSTLPQHNDNNSNSSASNSLVLNGIMANGNTNAGHVGAGGSDMSNAELNGVNHHHQQQQQQHNRRQHAYNPELNQDQNPYYYAKNKLLHNLHLERMKRAHQ